MKSKNSNKEVVQNEPVVVIKGNFIEKTSKHDLYGCPGSISVQRYNTESINHFLAVDRNLVYCNERLSVSNTDRACSVAKICDQPVSNVCADSLRFYIGFRDLFVLLQNEIEYLPEVMNYTSKHVEKIRLLFESV